MVKNLGVKKAKMWSKLIMADQSPGTESFAKITYDIPRKHETFVTRGSVYMCILTCTEIPPPQIFLNIRI